MTEAAAPDSTRFTARVVKGSAWTLAGLVAPLGVSIVTAPIVIRLLGAEAYGVLALLVVIQQYLYFADFGMSLASTKFGSAAYAEGDLEKEARVVRTAAMVALAASIPVAAVLAIFSREVAVLFNVPERLLGETSLAIKVAAATLVLTLLGLVVNSPLLARLRMDVNTLITSGTRMAGMIATPIVIYLGGGIIGAAIVMFAAALLNVVGHIAASARLLPRFLELSVDRESLRQLLRFGLPMCIAAVAAMALTNLERGALSAFTSVKQLAYYSVAFSLSSVLTLGSGAMHQSLIPVFSQLQSETSRERRNAIYTRSIRLITIAMLPVLGLAGIAGELILTVFAGPEFAKEGTVLFYILLLGIVFTIAVHTPAAALIASGRTDLFARIYWLELPPYALLVWMLISRYGAVGAAVAWTIRVSLDAALQFALAARYAGVTFDRGHLPSVLGVAVIAVAPFAAYLLFGLSTLMGISIGLAGLAIYALVVWRFVLRHEELAWAAERLKARFAR